MSTDEFWSELETAVSPTQYQPHRRGDIISARIETPNGAYYILKQPHTHEYLRLSEEDYALWWQMNGRLSIKSILFYNLRRFKSLPISRFTQFVDTLKQSHFLQDDPVNVYDQIQTELDQRTPASRGRRLLNGFLETKLEISGLDGSFIPLHRRTKWLFSSLMQFALLALIIVGGVLFGVLFWNQKFTLLGDGSWSVVTLFVANLVVIGIHELAHGLTVKHYGRELDRGGFLIYWGLPAFYVDTRDMWLSPRRERIAVSWAGPHSGLIIGGAMGLLLTAVLLDFLPIFISTFFYQLGFIAYLTVFFNLNPLLELDGYFMLMDWLEMPNLRARAIHFWREQLWGKLKAARADKTLGRLYPSLPRTEQIFLIYGGLTIAYSIYALIFALYYWRDRIVPFVESLWSDYGTAGQMAVLGLTTVLIIPAIYFIAHYGWSRIQAGLEWLAHRDLLARPDVLALLLGIPILAGIPLILLALSAFPQGEIWVNLFVWLLHLGSIAALLGVARQLPGSRFQWAMVALTAVPFSITIAWAAHNLDAPFLRDVALFAAAAAAIAFGAVSWFTIRPTYRQQLDRAVTVGVILLGVLYAAGLYGLNGRLSPHLALITVALFIGFTLATPLWLNFARSRFALPWLLIILAMLTVPLLPLYPQFHLPVLLLWLYGGLLYLLLSSMAEFKQHQGMETGDVAIYNERQRLIDGFNHFMTAFFSSYEAVFGGRRLAAIQAEIQTRGVLDLDDGILEISNRCRTGLLLAIDRLDDLAGTPFTRKAGQAAYDSLPWLEAETLGQRVLSQMEWGSGLAQGFIRAQDGRRALVRGADIFAGMDAVGIGEITAVLQPHIARKGTFLGRQEHDATHFFLIESGEVAVLKDGEQIGIVSAGGYGGTQALLASGEYAHSYQAIASTRTLRIARDQFDPLLRADTTLAKQVSSGDETRQLLKKLPLFRDLSPQQLSTIDARLRHRAVNAGDVIVQQGDVRSDLFIIVTGEVDLLLDEKINGNLGAGEYFGEYALFADTPYMATYRAKTAVKLLLLDEEKFDELTADSASMSHYVEQRGTGRAIAGRRGGSQTTPVR